MAIQDQFPEVHWVWKGDISFVYEVHPRIVVKVPKTGEFEREQFQKELKIYETFLQQPPCPSIVQFFLYADNGIFLEYMRDESLWFRIQSNHVRDEQTMIITKIERLEPSALRKKWMNDLAQAVAFLESPNLAHGDLRPEDILLDRNQLKLSDFDCTAEIGTDFEACMASYGRVLNNSEPYEGRCGSSGLLGPRTEQFALGSLYYLINYGMEVYGDQCLTEDPKEHGPKVVELLQNMDFPQLNSDPLIDEIIKKWWHNEYKMIADLASNIETLLSGRPNAKGSNAKTNLISRWVTALGRITRNFWRTLWHCWAVAFRYNDKPVNAEISNDSEPPGYGRGVHPDNLTEDFMRKQALCQSLQRRGLPQLLSSGEPEHLGFTLKCPDDFKNYLLLKVVVNKSIDEVFTSSGKKPNLPGTGNPRAEKQTIQYASRTYVRWRDLWCGVGPRSTKMSRADILHGNGDGRNLSQWLGYNQVAFIPVRMPTPEERFLWVDLTYPIRGIYLPSAFYAMPQQKYKEWTRYIQLKFFHNSLTLKTYTRADFYGGYLKNQSRAQAVQYAAQHGEQLSFPSREKTVKEPDVPEEPNLPGMATEFTVGELKIPKDRELGLGYQPTWTARFDIQQLALTLHVPSEMRDEKYLDTYQFITLFNSGDVDFIQPWQMTKAREVELSDQYIKHADVINLQESTDMKERPTKADFDWLRESVRNLIGVGLGIIPYVGPFLSMGYDAVMDYLDNPEAWGVKNELKLGTQAKAQAIKSTSDILEFYKKGKVPHIQFKSGLEEGDDRQPVYVGEEGQEAEGTQQEPSIILVPEEDKTEADQSTVGPDEAPLGGFG
ncbi:uncharacterized protein KD926_008597 [Aspergillus affinis]|uniref:uncharacterized protein n=1 Tax=Aspergillus affinis TaxID=1070780 RepID=UPI0022FE4D1C|nr:uncharacterized protein KD926_008597 [Aspergillus affinis]KAI9040152.1 hypothetical protein KD926_008597 [Aspergillus affinis]